MSQERTTTSDRRSIATSTLWQFSSQIAMAALSILTTKFIAVGLSKELAGHYNSAYGYLQLFGILADFGLYAVAVREVSKAVHRAHVLSTLIVLRVITLSVSLGLALTAVWLIPAWRGTPLPLGVTIAAGVPLFTLLSGILRVSFQVNFRLQYVFVAEVSQRIISTTLIGLLLWYGIRESTDVRMEQLFLLSGSAGAVVLFLVSAVFAQRLLPIKFVWDPALLKHLLKQCAPYGIAFLCTALYRQLDQTLIALLRPDDFALQNAYYGFVLRMGDMAFLLPTFLLNSVLPVVAQRRERGEKITALLQKTLLAILTLSAIVLCFASLWSRPLVQLLTTSAYLSSPGHPGSDTALMFMSIPFALNGLITFSFYLLLTLHQWKPLVWLLSGGAALSILCNVILIPQMGFLGAATTSVIVHCLLTILLLWQSTRRCPIRLPLESLARWTVFAVGLAVFLFLVQPMLTSNTWTILGLAAAGVWIAGLAMGSGLKRLILE